MAISLKKVRETLDVDEPDYAAAAAELGAEALPHLKRLVETAEPLLASKAAYLATMIGGARATEVVEAAVRHVDPTVRIAAAAGASNLISESTDSALQTLLSDTDPGVRKTALRSVSDNASDQLRARVAQIARQESDPTLVELSQDALARASGIASLDPSEDGEAAAGFGGGSIESGPASDTSRLTDGASASGFGGGSVEGGEDLSLRGDSSDDGGGGGSLDGGSGDGGGTSVAALTATGAGRDDDGVGMGGGN